MLLKWIFAYKAQNGDLYFHAGKFTALNPWGQMVVSNGMVLPPVLLLYLVPMTRAASAGVVTAWVVVLNAFIILQPSARYATSFVCLLAFMALLVAFLAQAQTIPMSGG